LELGGPGPGVITLSAKRENSYFGRGPPPNALLRGGGGSGKEEGLLGRFGENKKRDRLGRNRSIEGVPNNQQDSPAAGAYFWRGPDWIKRSAPREGGGGWSRGALLTNEVGAKGAFLGKANQRGVKGGPKEVLGALAPARGGG